MSDAPGRSLRTERHHRISPTPTPHNCHAVDDRLTRYRQAESLVHEASSPSSEPIKAGRNARINAAITYILSVGPEYGMLSYSTCHPARRRSIRYTCSHTSARTPSTNSLTKFSSTARVIAHCIEATAVLPRSSYTSAPRLGSRLGRISRTEAGCSENSACRIRRCHTAWTIVAPTSRTHTHFTSCRTPRSNSPSKAGSHGRLNAGAFSRRRLCERQRRCR